MWPVGIRHMYGTVKEQITKNEKVAKGWKVLCA